MGAFQNLRLRLFPTSWAQAEMRVIAAERELAKLQAKVHRLPPGQRAAFATQIRALAEKQARARGDLRALGGDCCER